MTREQARAKAKACIASAMGESTEAARRTMAMVAAKLIHEHKLLEDDAPTAAASTSTSAASSPGAATRQRMRADAVEAAIDFGAEFLNGVLRPRRAPRRRAPATARRR